MDKINKRVVIALYRNKLKIAHSLGYTYGIWNNNNIVYEHETIGRYLKKKRRSNNLGNYIMDNVRYRYKINRNIRGNDLINLCIDDGFKVLKNLNEIIYKK